MHGSNTPSSDAARDEWSAERWSLQCQVHIRSFSGVVCIQYRGLLGLSRTQVCVKDAIASLQKRHVHAVRAGVLLTVTITTTKVTKTMDSEH